MLRDGHRIVVNTEKKAVAYSIALFMRSRWQNRDELRLFLRNANSAGALATSCGEIYLGLSAAIRIEGLPLRALFRSGGALLSDGNTILPYLRITDRKNGNLTLLVARGVRITADPTLGEALRKDTAAEQGQSL